MFSHELSKGVCMTERDLDIAYAKNVGRWQNIQRTAAQDYEGELQDDPSILYPVPKYSSDPEQKKVIEEFLEGKGGFRMKRDGKNYVAYVRVEAAPKHYIDPTEYYSAAGVTEQIALCKVALKVALRRRDLP
jgi:hypothetical protein